MCTCMYGGGGGGGGEGGGTVQASAAAHKLGANKYFTTNNNFLYRSQMHELPSMCVPLIIIDMRVHTPSTIPYMLVYASNMLYSMKCLTYMVHIVATAVHQ